MLSGKSKIIARTIKSKGHSYSQLFIYLPKNLVTDSAFPLKAGDEIEIRAQGKQLVIEKV